MPGREDMELDLSGDLSELKKKVFTIKEGVSYKIRIDFYVQREIVHGLKYIQKTSRLGVTGMYCILKKPYKINVLSLLINLSKQFFCLLKDVIGKFYYKFIK